MYNWTILLYILKLTQHCKLTNFNNNNNNKKIAPRVKILNTNRRKNKNTKKQKRKCPPLKHKSSAWLENGPLQDVPGRSPPAGWHQGWTERMRLDPAPGCHGKASATRARPALPTSSGWGQRSSAGQRDSVSKGSVWEGLEADTSGSLLCAVSVLVACMP